MYLLSCACYTATCELLNLIRFFTIIPGSGRVATLKHTIEHLKAIATRRVSTFLALLS